MTTSSSPTPSDSPTAAPAPAVQDAAAETTAANRDHAATASAVNAPPAAHAAVSNRPAASVSEPGLDDTAHDVAAVTGAAAGESVLVLQTSRNGHQVTDHLQPALDGVELLCPTNVREGLEQLQSGTSSRVLFWADASGDGRLAGVLLECGGVLEQVPEGYCLVDLDETVLWSNAALRRLSLSDSRSLSDSPSLTGQPFEALFGDFQYIDETTSALDAAIGTGETATTTIRTEAGSFYEIQATPLCEPGSGLVGEDDCCDEGESDRLLVGACEPSSLGVEAAHTLPAYLLISVRDVTATVAQRKKLEAIDEAGIDLGDLAPEDILDMQVEDRVELLKEKIAYYIDDLLQYETVEIRLLEEATGELSPLLAIGMTEEAASRPLFSSEQGQGVTGFVAATGKSYRCDHTTDDPLYLQGAAEARSSLTVPLVQHGEVIGTFNVESRQDHGFDDTDLTFLKRFSREVAAALNTLELLAIEKTATAAGSVEKILCQISAPLDEILNSSAYMLDAYIGHDQPVAERLRQILKDARDIRARIQAASQATDCSASIHSALPELAGPPESRSLRGKRILVVDNDQSVRMAAHEILGRYGANVETSPNGEEAAIMARSFHYDAVLIDIRLPDMSGSECFRRLREIGEHLPLILMTGYGYDPTHSIVKARDMGLQAVLFKPFRLDQLLTEVGKAVSAPATMVASA